MSCRDVNSLRTPESDIQPLSETETDAVCSRHKIAGTQSDTIILGNIRGVPTNGSTMVNIR